MIIYGFSADTKEFTGEFEASPNPLAPGEFFIPAYSTQAVPPDFGKNEIPVFDNNSEINELKAVGDLTVCPNGSWTIVPDLRGTKYYDSELRLFTVEKINETVDWSKNMTFDEMNTRTIKQSKFNFDSRKWDIDVVALKTAVALATSEYRYSLQESTILSNDVFSNKTATYNTQLHKEAIETFENGTPVRWRNLDGTRIDITNENLPKLKSLLNDIRVCYQRYFSAQEILEVEIMTETDLEKLRTYDAKAKFTAALDLVG